MHFIVILRSLIDCTSYDFEIQIHKSSTRIIFFALERSTDGLENVRDRAQRATSLDN